MTDSIWTILSSNASDHAIGAPGRPWLDGAGLHALAEQTRQALNSVGIGRGDRVGIVLPNGPEMATCFVSVAAACTAAPLNPAYTADEFDFYLFDLKPRAIILQLGDATPARAVAERLGVAVIELHPQADAAAGLYRLDASGLPDGAAAEPGAAGADDMALVLHTSGTTARPKIVPLTNAQHRGLRTGISRESLALVAVPIRVPERDAAVPHPWAELPR